MCLLKTAQKAEKDRNTMTSAQENKKTQTATYEALNIDRYHQNVCTKSF